MEKDIDSNPACITRKYDSSKYKSSTGPLIPTKIPDNHIIAASNETTIIQYYYLDINNMNQKQLDYFKKYAKFEKMCPQDYINWLYLNEKELSGYNKYMWYTHFVLGYEIKKEDIPIKKKRSIKREEKRLLDNSILDKLKGAYR